MFAVLVLSIAGILADADNSVNLSLRFPEEVSINNYVKLNPDFSKLGTSLSICTWIKIFRNSREVHFWFSYAAVPSKTNEILLSDYDGLWLGSTGYNWKPVVMLKNEWYHYCFTWSGATKLMDIYLNGVLVKSQQSSASNIHSAPGNVLILGQDQDTMGGSFDVKQSFGGDIHQLNVFSRKLRLEEVAAMYFNGRCSPVPSSLVYDVALSWETFLGAERYGDVKEVPAECKKCNDRNFLGKVAQLFLQELNTCNA